MLLSNYQTRHDKHMCGLEKTALDESAVDPDYDEIQSLVEVGAVRKMSFYTSCWLNHFNPYDPDWVVENDELVRDIQQSDEVYVDPDTGTIWPSYTATAEATENLLLRIPGFAVSRDKSDSSVFICEVYAPEREISYQVPGTNRSYRKAVLESACICFVNDIEPLT